MANEFKVKNGLILQSGSLTLPGTLVVSGSAGTTGQYLKSTGTGLQWATVTTASSVSTLTDVTLTSVATNNLLKYDGSNWVNSSTLGGLTLTSPTINGGALSGTFTGAPTLSNTTASTSSTTGSLKLGGGLGVAGNIYVGSSSKVGFVNASNVSAVYQYYNAATNSLDTVFG